MKRRVTVFVGLLLLALALVACASRASESVEVTRTASEVVMEEAAPAIAYEAEGDFAMDTGSSAANEPMAPAPAEQPPAGQQRLIIRNAEMSIVVSDTEAALAQIAQMAENGGGWVVSSNVYESSETSKTGYIQIRVPAEGFQSVLDAIAGLAVSVENLSTSGQDVTEEYVDLSSQLANLEATAARVRGFLDDATRVQDALDVNAELSRLEGEIAVIRGRMQYLSQSAAFSSITVGLTPDELAQPIEVAGWQPQGVAKEAIEALVNALQSLANLLIWVIIFLLPIVVLIAIPVLLIRWLLRRARQRRAAPVE